MQISISGLFKAAAHKRFVQQRSLEFMSFLVGGLAGITGAFFQVGVHVISDNKRHFADTMASNIFAGWAWAGITSAIMLIISLWLVRKYAPEAAGSGIQEIEGTLAGIRPIRWWRVLPVKFFSGLLSLSSGMILGREGPSVQMGANGGAFVNSTLPHKNKNSRHALVAAGAAAGLTAAFNAPLAGMIFVMEEMRDPFRSNFLNVRLLAIAVLTATLVVNLIIGEQPSLPIPLYQTPAWHEMLLYLLMGGFLGAIGAALNKSILKVLDWMDKLKQKPARLYLWIAFIGFSIGIINYFYPDVVGGGYALVNHSIDEKFALNTLLIIIAVRFTFTIICFCSGVPGGVFAPMIVLGTLIGLWFGNAITMLMPDMANSPYPFAVAGMGALFAATVQAPITAIVLVVEMTANYFLIIPIMIACVGADIVAHELGIRPLYTILLERQLKNERLAAEKKRAMKDSKT